MKRLVAGLLTLALITLLLPPRLVDSAAAPSPTVVYTLALSEPDRPRITVDVFGATEPVTRLTYKGSWQVREALSISSATDSDGRPLPWRWDGDSLVTENGQAARFSVSYVIDGLRAGSPAGQFDVVFRPLALFFTAANVFLIPAQRPERITVKLDLPPGTTAFSSLPEEGGSFTAVPDLWGDLRYDFAKAYFTGGRPLLSVTRTTAWGDTYQYVWFDRDPASQMWAPSYGNAPWEEAEAYLAMTERLAAYIRDHIMGPLPAHKVLFTNVKQPGAGVASVLTNVDWFHYMQIWPRHSEPEVAHHLIHQYSFWKDQTKLPLDYSGQGRFLREGLATYLEQTVPAAVLDDQTFPGKLFEFYALEQRGQAFGIGANEMHVKYNRSAMQVYLLDRYIKEASAGQRDIAAFAGALWGKVKDRTAPQDLDDGLVTSAFEQVAGPGSEPYFRQVATQNQFSGEDFIPLLPSFKTYVEEMADRYFWGNRLLFLAFLDIAAAKGGEWPHYATYPHNVSRYRQDALPPFLRYLQETGHSGLSREDVERALGAATGRDHAGFFAFWSSLGIDLDPAGLLPLSQWNATEKDETSLLLQGGYAGSLQTEHYLSGLPQKAAVLLDRPAPSETVLFEVHLRSFEGYPPTEAATAALSAPLEFTRQVMDGNVYVTQVVFRITTTDPERRRFDLSNLTLPAFAYHAQFQVYRAEQVEDRMIGSLYWVHSVDPVPFMVRTAGGVVSLPAMPTLADPRFEVTTGGRIEAAVPGRAIPVGAGWVQVDLLDGVGFLRGRQVLSTNPDSIQVVCDGRLIDFDVPPQLIDGRVLVPFRAISEALGAEVGWDPDSQTVTLTQRGRTVTLIIGAPVAQVAGRTVALDVPAQPVGGRTLVPVRFIGEALDATVGWNQESQAVIISTHP
ncbi:MAG TPA: stalk domain-containing protein [Bacillota bacterium]